LTIEQVEAGSVLNHAQETSFRKKQEQQPHQQQQRIYLVTDGLRSKHTKIVYRVAFNQFLREGAHTTDIQVLLDYKPRVLESMVIGYVEYLRDKRRAHNTIQLHCAAIFHFFEMNDVILNKRKIMRFVPPDESPSSSASQGDYYADGVGEDKPYTLEDICRIINEGCGGDTRSRVIVLLMASTGMRIGALPGLRYGDLSYIPEHNLYKIRVYATSRVDRYITYCTPECAAAINAYLDYRRRLGETIKDSSPLIREMFNVENPFVIDSPRSSTSRMIELALEQALKKSGVNQRTAAQAKGSRRSIMRSHGFRKFVITTMDKAGVKDTHRRYLTGHAQVGQDGSYVLPNEKDLLAEYLKAEDLLTIDPTQRLQKENQELKSTRSEDLEEIHRKWLLELQQERVLLPLQEWNAFKAQIDELKKYLPPFVEDKVKD
jgi:integrase